MSLSLWRLILAGRAMLTSIPGDAAWRHSLPPRDARSRQLHRGHDLTATAGRQGASLWMKTDHLRG